MRLGRLGTRPPRSCWPQVDALPPGVDEPDIAVDEAAEPAPTSLPPVHAARTRRLVHRPAVLVGSTRWPASPGRYLVRRGIDDGVAGRRPGLAVAAVGLFLLVVVAITGWSTSVDDRRPADRRGLLFGLRVRVFAHLQRLWLDYYDREMAAGS